MSRKVTTTVLTKMKQRGERIAMITAYDATFSRLLDEAGADLLLVGDSLGMVVQGRDDTSASPWTTWSITPRLLPEAPSAPSWSATCPSCRFKSARKMHFATRGGCCPKAGRRPVKVEGGRAIAPTVERLVQAGIPVMGHIGLTPQSVHQLGGFRVQGRGSDAARALMDDAMALQAAGCFAIVLELVPGELSERISKRLDIPTIGIGAGPGCDGQVLVCYDLLGMNDGFKPKFLKTYDTLADSIRGAAGAYVSEVRNGVFPGPEHTFDDPSTRSEEPPAPVPLYGGGGQDHAAAGLNGADSTLEPAAAVV